MSNIWSLLQGALVSTYFSYRIRINPPRWTLMLQQHDANIQRVSLASDYNHSEFDVFVVVGATNAIIVSRSMQRRNVAEPASARARNMLHCSAGRCEWHERHLGGRRWLRWGRWAVEVLRLRAAETVGSRQKHESELAESIMERARQHMSYEMSANTDHPPTARCGAVQPFRLTIHICAVTWDIWDRSSSSSARIGCVRVCGQALRVQWRN